MLALRKGRAPTLARRGEPATAGAELPNGFEAFAVAYGDRWSLAEEIVQHGADVVVLAPAELRDSVVRALRAVAETAAQRERAELTVEHSTAGNVADERQRGGHVTSQAQVRRLLSLVPYLREHDGVAMADVAAAFGITSRRCART